MKLHLVFLSRLLLCLAAAPAMAQTVYTNGPINGTTDAWNTNFGFVVSDTFVLSNNSTLTGLNFGAWLFPGDVLFDAEISITSSEFGGTVYTDQVVNFTQSGCSGNQFGFNVCNETGTFPTAVNLAPGTYWLNIENSVVNDDPVYWDENSGPSQASENSVGTIPSEAFTILGTTGTTTTGGSTPEPGSFMLLGSGTLGLAGVLTRRLFKA